MELYEHNLGDHEDPIAGPTWTVGIVGTVLFAVILLGLAGLNYAVMTEERAAKVFTEVPLELELIRAQQLQRLEGPTRRELRIENPEGEASIVIPLDRAIDIIVEEAGQ